MKKKIIGYVSGVLVCLTVLLIGLKYSEHKKGSESVYDITEYQDTYETNQYQVFKQFRDLLYNCEPDQIVYQRDTVINDLLYHQYGNEDITINVISMDNNTESTIGDYNIIYNNKEVTMSEDIPQNIESISIYYVDINKDLKKDVVLIGEPYSGSNNTYYWIHIVDLASMQEIPAFSSEKRYLTIDQEEQLKILLSEDEKFNETFQDLEGMDYSSRPVIDVFGNVYYNLGLGKGKNEDIGEIIVLFSYNIDTNKFDVVDYVYMPKQIN